MEPTTALTSGASSLQFQPSGIALSQQEKHCQDRNQRKYASDAHDIHYYSTVFSGSRIVVVAIEQQLIDR
jgi:hypothetical protein